MQVWDLSEIEAEFTKIEEGRDHKGYGLFRLFKCDKSKKKNRH